MAAISNPEAVRFVNEVVRPLCEAARDLKVKIDAAAALWAAGMSAHFATDADTVNDGRESEGVSRLTAAHVKAAAAQLIKVGSGQAAEWNGPALARCCVRQLPGG